MRILLSVVLFPVLLSAQPFTRGIFGQSYWQCPDNMGPGNGYWLQTAIGWSEAKVVRAGGDFFNVNMLPPTASLVPIVNQIKAQNMLPIVTIPIGTQSQNWNVTNTIIPHAIAILNALNSSGTTQTTPFTKYFIIGNEPDLDGQVNPQNVYAWDVNDIYARVGPIISAMTAHQASLDASVTLQFLGPELSSFRNNYDATYPVGFNNMVDKLTTNVTSTNLMTGSSKLDFFTFHYYATYNQGNVGQWDPVPTRSNLKQTLTQTLQTQGGKTVSALKQDLTQLRSNLGTSGKIGITEANICTANDVSNNGINDSLDGNGANSFLAGQFWAEIIGVGLEKDIDLINFWSAIEGATATSNSYSTNIGYWNVDPALSYSQAPWTTSGNTNEKYTWSHFYALALSLKGTYYPGANLSSDIKMFGTNFCGGHTIVIMNQSTAQGSQSLVVNVGNGNTLGNYASTWASGNIDLAGTTGRDIIFDEADWNFNSFESGLHAQIRDEETIIIQYDNCDNPIFWSRIRRGDVAVRYYVSYYPSGYPECNCSFADPFDPW